jgi:8-oxo-dGTP diphosphatase
MDLRKKKVVATIVFPIKGSEVLLAKKTKKIGVGLWNGWGGAQEERETIRQTALREFAEESGLSANLENLEYAGKVTFHNQKADGRKFDVEVHMFLLRKWSGELKSNPEMIEPTFWPIDNLPFDQMMASDRDWLPFVMKGERIDGDVWYILDQNHLAKPSEIRKEIRKVKNVFLWGTFDVLHDGHFRLFQETSKLGNLYIIVLPDERISESKQIVHNENKRKENLLKTKYAKGVFIDALPDLKCFDSVPPDIFCFGYDQDGQWQEKIKNHIVKKFPWCKFITMDKYADIHSSHLRGGIYKNSRP